ncbi:hypothetical protein ABW18_19910 [Gordonia jacobaea]|uniref:Uncharacterized protein n=1 Tax=Gordonia jacobaea TaxID=122202 RepID=A0ABR5I7P5_9ACTN|nr:hypothetical protein ABW18_19910 [Gordonia jacobaea]
MTSERVAIIQNLDGMPKSCVTRPKRTDTTGVGGTFPTEIDGRAFLVQSFWMTTSSNGKTAA